MPAPTRGDQPLIMIVGVGDLSARLLNMLLANPATTRVVLAGRDPAALRARANLAAFTAANLGVTASPDVARLDLTDVDGTAQTIAELGPDIIFMGASLQSWRVITRLPKDVFEELDQAQLGPWLPMHLAPNYQLMRAVRMSGTGARVINAAYPDVVGPALAKIGLAPTVGIGNVANIIPALTYAYAHAAGADPAAVRVRLVAQHYFSHYVPRFGDAGAGAYHLTAWVGEEKISDRIPDADIFGRLTGPLKRLGGVEGQLLTASSAMSVIAAMAGDSGAPAHAPAPGGLPGGYPVRVGRDGATPDLDPSLTVGEAIRINEECQRADGIERIAEDGTVTFTEQEMAVMRKMLGYDCPSLKPADAAQWAQELGGKYAEFAARYA